MAEIINIIHGKKSKNIKGKVEDNLFKLSDLVSEPDKETEAPKTVSIDSIDLALMQYNALAAMELIFGILGTTMSKEDICTYLESYILSIKGEKKND
jgi:hypothetical protein